MDIAPFRRLVGYISEEPHALFSLVCHEVTEDVSLGDTYSAFALSDVFEQFVKDVAAQRMIDQSAYSILVSLEGKPGGGE